MKVHQTFRIEEGDLLAIKSFCKLHNIRKQDWFELAITEKLKNETNQSAIQTAKTIQTKDFVPQIKPVPQSTVVSQNVPQSSLNVAQIVSQHKSRLKPHTITSFGSKRAS